MLDTCQLIYRRDVIGLQKKTFMISTAHSAATYIYLVAPMLHVRRPGTARLYPARSRA